MAKKIIYEETSTDCRHHLRAFNDTLHILSGKWIAMIIGNLAHGKKRFQELQRAVDGIGSKMLSKDLQELELNGLIRRTVINTKPITVEYELTEYGHTLKPIIDAMANWGRKHRERIIKEMTTTESISAIAEVRSKK